jgi:trk system potassium uptake protein TrkA
MANYAVIGLEKFGYFVAKFLSERGEFVLAIDSDVRKVEEVKVFVDQAICIDAKNSTVLHELGLQKVDMVLVCLDHKLDESVIITQLLLDLPVRNIICLAGSEKHEKIMRILGVHEVIFPERQAALFLVESLLTAVHKDL